MEPPVTTMKRLLRERSSRSLLTWTTLKEIGNDNASAVRTGRDRDASHGSIPHVDTGSFFNPPTLPPSPQPATATGELGQENQVVVFVLSVFIIFLFGVFLSMVAPLVYRAVQSRIPVSQKRINRRYETIEGWVITKRVRAHDAECERMQKEYRSKKGKMDEAAEDYDNSLAGRDPQQPSDGLDKQLEEKDDRIDDPRALHPSASLDTADTSSNDESSACGSRDDYDLAEKEECPICMEGFAVDQVVSWSVNACCGHVFHHECIKEWLVRHANCPFCRCIMLPIDDGSSRSKQDILELSRFYHRQEVTSYCCSKDGLLFLQPNCNTTKKDWKQVLKLTAACKVDRLDLVKLRGVRTHGTDDHDDSDEKAESGVSRVHDIELTTNGPSVQRLEPESTMTHLSAVAFGAGNSLLPPQAIKTRSGMVESA